MVDLCKEFSYFLNKLFPINRSLAGKGNRETLSILKEIIPLRILEFPSGKKVYDWTIPKEWNVKEAWIKNSQGKKIIDFSISNIHLVSHSVSIHRKLFLNELLSHLHFLENKPEAIPYKTSFYSNDWGFCLSYNDFIQNFNSNEEYEVFIDCEFIEGSMSIGEFTIKGRSEKEILISTYICHPSMANDNLSGILVTAFVARELHKIQHQLEHSYRIVFAPETIGAITYCAHNENFIKKIDNALIVSTCGGSGKFGYKGSWADNSSINQMVEEVFRRNNIDFIAYPFDVHGSDERQYSSQAFRINCVTISKDRYYEYDFYHTHLDNLEFVKPENLFQSFRIYLELISDLDRNLFYSNLNPHCEVMLSKHGLYPKSGGSIFPGKETSELDIILWCLFFMDGRTSLFEISKKIGVSLDMVFKTAKNLEEKGIIARL